MICGDLLFTYKDNIENSKILIAYDRKLAIGTSFFGIRLIPLKQLQLEGLKVETFQLKEILSYAKRKKLGEHLLGMINKTIKLTLSERLNYTKYVNWIYSDILKINLLEHPSISVTPKNLSESKELIKWNSNY